MTFLPSIEYRLLKYKRTLSDMSIGIFDMRISSLPCPLNSSKSFCQSIEQSCILLYNKYRKSYERECIARAIVTSDHKSRNAQVSSYDFLFIIYLTKLLSGGRLRLRVAHARILQFFSFSRPCLPNIQAGLCSFNVFLFFAFSSNFSTMFCFDKANRLSAILFFISRTNMALPQCFHGNFRIATYNLYLYSITYLCIRL